MQSFACLGGLRNYENDPILAKAMEYDIEMNGGDLTKANRAMAEKYYLEYLKRPRESFQLARVYCQIGALYAVAVNERLGETPDYDKAAEYGRKALEAEPERLDICMIRARTLLLALNRPGIGRTWVAVDNYGFLKSVDANAVRARWLPRRPGDTPTQDNIQSVVNLAGGIAKLTEDTIDRVPKNYEDSEVEAVMQEILKRYSGTRLAEKAQVILGSRGLAAPVLNRPDVPTAAVNKDKNPPLGGNTPLSLAAAASVTSISEENGNYGGSPYLWVVAAVAVVAVAAGILLLKKKVFRSRDSTS